MANYSLLNIVNIAIESWSILACLLAVVLLLLSTSIEKEKKKYFVSMFLFTILNLVANIVGLLGKGKWYYVVKISNFFEFFFSGMVAVIFFLLVMDTIKIKEKKIKQYVYGVVFFSSIIYFISLVISNFKGWYYYIDENAIYHRGDLFWLTHLFGIVLFVIDISLLLKYRRIIGKKEFIAFNVYIWLPFLGIILSLAFYGIYWILITNTISGMFMLGFEISEQAEKYEKKEREIRDLKTSIMMSQIQPHFLYNSLTSIAQLCDDDPKKAKEATLAFSEYLRGNMNSLKSDLIPFRKELEHIRAYLQIEKIRFEDKLDVVFDIECDDFIIPSLSVQPLVENAIKHGIGAKSVGGTVCISSYEDDYYYVISINDNGVGFDISELPDTKSLHIGISNVRKRLDKMCNATLEINSQKGFGTQAVIKIRR